MQNTPGPEARERTQRCVRRLPTPLHSGTLRLLAACTMGLVLVACAPEPEPPTGWSQVYLTRDGGDVARVRIEGAGTVAVEADGRNTGTNSRGLLYPTESETSPDEQSCAGTTVSEQHAQEGVALRIAPSELGDHEGIRAITVTKNVWGHATHSYNVHLWDTTPAVTPSGMASSELIDSADMSVALHEQPTRERRLCARIEGQLLEIKVWPADDAEPDWGDPVHTHTTEVPESWVYAGRPGLYFGHLHANDWLRAVEVDFAAG